VLPKPFDLHRLFDEIARLLQLQWTAEPEPEPALPAVGGAAKPLGDEAIDELLRLGRIGYLRGIEAKLGELDDDPAHRPVVARLRSHLGAFDFEGFAAELEGLSDG
jgi:hypothetical protein